MFIKTSVKPEYKVFILSLINKATFGIIKATKGFFVIINIVAPLGTVSSKSRSWVAPLPKNWLIKVDGFKVKKHNFEQ